MKKLAIILLCILVSTAALADRPKVGVVLCGGGAKGAAHVGVLKVLEENGIPVDYIAGTSMGAIIGGLYSIGYSADELRELILAQDWDIVMSDRISRRDLSFEQKKGRDKYIITIPFGLGDYSRLSSWKERRTLQNQSFLSTIPMAIVSGQNIYNLFTRLSVGYQDSLDFNRMPIPFACVAVDLIEKKEVVFHSGNFVDAIRSSMAIPGYFAPVKMDNMVLIDGGSLNNYPVDVVKEMGADIVIGILLGGDEQKVPKVDNIGDIANEMMDMYLDVKKADNVNNTDILITPSVKGYNVLSFDTESLDSLMVNGEKAARDKEDELKSLKAMLDREDRIRAETFVGPEMRKVSRYAKAIHLYKDTVTIRSISVKGLDAKEVTTMLNKTKFKPGSRLTGSVIEDQIDKFYNTGAFESVTYALRGTEEPYDLDLNFVRGRNSSFSAGFRFDSEEIASIILNVGLNSRSFSGHRVDLTAKLAYNFQAQATYSYGFQSKTQFNFSYKFRSSDLNMFKQDYLSSFIFNEHSVIANFSTQRTRYWHSDIGGRIDAFQYRSMLASGQEPLSYDLAPDRKFFLRAYANLSFDSMDKIYFPTEGLKFEIEADYITDKLFNSEMEHPGFVAANLNLSGIIPCGSRVAIIPALAHRSLFGSQIPCAYANLMGGFEAGRYADQQMTFLGFTYAHLFETNLSTLTLDTRVRILENHYVFASGACAFDYHEFSEIMQNKPALGVRLGYAYDSFAGPLSLNLTWSDFTRKFGAYVSIGYSF